MGNTRSITELCDLQKQRGTLDLSLKVNYEQYCQHALGVAPEGSLTSLASFLPASPTLHSALNVSFNWLSEVPASLPERLPHLVSLDLSHNRLTALPDNTLLSLPHLRDLCLSHNLLHQLPQSLHLLPKLTRLNFSHNVIEQLPASLGSCASLRALDCSCNRIRQLPTALGKCRTLGLLLAAGNPCVLPPKDVCEKGSRETLMFLRALAFGHDPNSPAPVVNDWRDAREPQKLVFPRVLGGAALEAMCNSSGGVGGPKDSRSREHYVAMRGQQVGMQTARGLRMPLLPPSGSTSLDALELRDKIAGLLFGAVIGDSIGLATEFLSPDECLFHYSPLHHAVESAKNVPLPLLSHSRIIRDGHRVQWDRGDWTSLSDIMLLLVDSLIQWGGVVDELDFALRLKSWAEAARLEGDEAEGSGDEAAGMPETRGCHPRISSPVIREVLSKPNFSSFPHEAALVVWQEANKAAGASESADTGETSWLDSSSLPQAIVLGVPHFYNLSEVTSNSLRICLTLHQDHACIAASVATSVIVAKLLQGRRVVGSDTVQQQQPQSTLDWVFRSARDAAWPHLEACSAKVQSAFEACFWPRSESELAALVTEEPQHPFTTLSVAVNMMRADCKASSTSPSSQGDPYACGHHPTATDTVGMPFPTDNGSSWRALLDTTEAGGESSVPFQRGVSGAALLCGHASANCCLTGALLGCLHGYSLLPAHWVEGLNASKRTLLTARVNALLNLMGLP